MGDWPLLLLEQVLLTLGAAEYFLKVEILCLQSPNRAIRVWTYAMPDGKLEQHPVAPIG
jgi:hypothetical protein